MASLAEKFGVTVKQLAALEGQLRLDTASLADLMRRYEAATWRVKRRATPSKLGSGHARAPDEPLFHLDPRQFNVTPLTKVRLAP
eukprot:787659-Prorocentrum_minimum.AAC.1